MGLGWESFEQNLATLTRDHLCAETQGVTFIPTPNPKDTSTMKILALDLGMFNPMRCFFDTKTRKPTYLTAPTERSYPR